MEIKALGSILKHINHGAVRVSYWNGEEVVYGAGEPLVRVFIHSPKAVRAMLLQPSIGFGEGYMNGLIDIDGPLDQINRLVNENKSASPLLKFARKLQVRQNNIKSRQRLQIAHHYDIGNDFYKLWLDKTMMYSCAYFKKPTDTLEMAQKQKIHHLLKKLQLKSNMRLLDIGCGWGSLLITAAKEYGISGMGITLSEKQYEHATLAAKNAGVSKKVTFELTNYQDLAKRGEKFDRIISVGMYEHVGRGNHAHYFDALDAMLQPHGLSVLHTITHTHETPTDPWIDKYIFPGGYIPSVRETVNKLPKHNFQLVDYENLRIHYAMTLDEWWHRYEKHKKKIIKTYDEKFYRMWRFYLASSSAAFRYGDLNLSQFVFTRGNDNTLPLTREHLYK